MLKEIEYKNEVRNKITNFRGQSAPREVGNRYNNNQHAVKNNQHNSENVQVKANKEMLKKTLKMNLLTLALLFIVVPRQIITIMSENCNDDLGECNFFLTFMGVIPLIQLLSAIIHPLVVLWVMDSFTDG